MGIAEILAKRKAEAAAKEASTVSAPAPEPASEPAPVAAPAPKVEEPPKEDKPLSFAERIALKKAQAAMAPAPAEAPVKEESPIAALASTPPAAANLSFADKIRAQKEAVAAAQKSAPVPRPEIDPSRIPANPEEAQNFVDIVNKINELQNLMEDDLQGGMSALKDALKKNPAAADLLLDEEVGAMVIALRRMRGIVVAEASKEKTKGRKPKAKEVSLSKEELDKAWSEL